MIANLPLIPEFLQDFLFSFFTLFIILYLLLQIYHYYIVRKSKDLLKNFSFDPATNQYEETKPKIFINESKAELGVLLLHGFSASTLEFRELVTDLKKKKVPFYNPAVTGFGIGDLHLLRSVKPTDWIRDALNGFELLQKQCEKIIIVGHSMGAVLACIVAQQKPVEKLILTSPYLFEKRKHTIIKSILLMPLLSTVFILFKPIVKKSSNKLKNYPQQRFVNSCVPTNAIRCLWQLQTFVDFGKINAKEFHLLLGGKDRTIENDLLISRIKSSFPTFSIEFFEKSGHNLLEESEKVEVRNSIITKITEW